MKNMVLLIDINVIMDYLLKREGFFDDARKVMELCIRGDATGYVAFHSIATIWYLLRGMGDESRRDLLRETCRILKVVGASHEAVERAIDMADFRDFEDCLQDQCALSVGADYLVTRNVQDFVHAGTEAITPSDFLKLVP